jgi:ankyrin repeat protein
MSHEWQLLAAAANGDSDKVGLMILTGTQSIDCRDSENWTPLLNATAGSREGHLHSVQWLLMSKTDVNAVNRDNVTPLHLAVLGRNEAIVVLLLRERACVDAVDKNNTTPLFMAAMMGNQNTVALLLQNNADVTKERQGLTTLDCAVNEGHDKIAEMLRAAAGVIA